MKADMEFIRGKKFLNFLFIACIVFAFLSFIRVFHIHDKDFYIPIIEKTYVPLYVNVEIPKEKAEEFHIYMDNKKIKSGLLFKNNSYVLYGENFPVKKLYFTADDTVLKEVKSIVVNLGKNFYYYDNKKLLSFEKTSDGKYLFPYNMRYSKNTEFINKKGELSNFSVKFLSVFYNTKFYVIPLIFLFLAVLIYQTNKDKMMLKFTLFENSAILWIVIIAILLRLADINVPFWGDELYTATVASGVDLPFINTFKDPGNPPLFFILAKIWMIIFGNTEAVCKTLCVLISASSVFAAYIFVKRNFNKNAGLLAALLLAVNFYSINTAQEFRCYSLCILLSLLSAYFLFEIIKDGKNKDFIFYAVVAALMANCHYFQILFLINNFIYAMALFDNKKRIKFLYANIPAALFFLPYFLMTGLNQGLLDEKFNAIPMYGIDVVFYFIRLYATDALLFLFFIICCLYGLNKIKKNIFDENKSLFILFIYSLYSVIYLFITAYLFSRFVRPIIKSIYFMEIIPFFLIALSLVFFMPFKNKVLKCLICTYALLMCVFYHQPKVGYADKNDLSVIRVEELIKYAYYDVHKFNGKKAAILIFDFPKQYVGYYKDYDIKNINVLFYTLGMQMPEAICETIESSGSNTIYTMLHKQSYLYYVEYYSKAHNVSLIKTDKEVYLARIIKK